MSMGHGYLVWRREYDAIDPDLYVFSGAQVNCAISSPKHDAIIVSMGRALNGPGWVTVWDNAGYAIVSDMSK
jgi:hypothetical protein